MRRGLFATFPLLFEEQHLFPHWLGSKQLFKVGVGRHERRGRWL